MNGLLPRVKPIAMKARVRRIFIGFGKIGMLNGGFVGIE